MKKIILLFACLFIIGCGGSGDSAPPATTPTTEIFPPQVVVFVKIADDLSTPDKLLQNLIIETDKQILIVLGATIQVKVGDIITKRVTTDTSTGNIIVRLYCNEEILETL